MEFQPDVMLNKRYRIIKLLGQGGMGAVYLAHDTSLDNQVAIKVNFKITEESTTQFLREARMLASLRHSNLPRVIDYFFLDQNQFLVMDFVPGDDLDTYVRKNGRPSIEQIIEWARQLGSALSYLHSNKPTVIHRDIKPGNIKLTPAGNVMLVDFGIAKAAETSQATATGALGYTPGYAPPEQYGAGRTRTGPYSDQYAFAATLYRLLTGEMPADSVQRAVGEAILIPIKQLIPSVPLPMRQAIERAMSLKPEDRFPNVDEFVKALTSTLYEPTRVQPVFDETIAQPVTYQSPQSIQGGIEQPIVNLEPVQPISYHPQQQYSPPSLIPTRPPESETSRSWVKWLFISLAIALIVIVIFVGGGYLLISNGGISFSAATPTIDPNIIVQQTTIAAGWAALSATPTLYLTPIPPMSTPTETITPSSSITETPDLLANPIPSPSSDGGLIAFTSQRGSDITHIWTMQIEIDESGNPIVSNFIQVTTGMTSAQMPAWSPDGNFLLYVASGGEGLGLDIWKLDYSTPGQNPVNITQKQGDQTEPAWSPDGKLIAYSDYSRSDGVPALEIINPDGSGRQRILSDYGESSPAWYPDSSRLLFVRYDRGYQVLNTYLAPDFDRAEKIDPSSPYGQLGLVEDPVVSPDGLWITYTQANTKMTYIYTLRADSAGNDYRNLTTQSYRESQPDWAPGGGWIAFTSSRDGSNFEIYIMDENGQKQTNLSNDAGIDMQPAWRSQ